jgi:hypothetical protein
MRFALSVKISQDASRKSHVVGIVSDMKCSQTGTLNTCHIMHHRRVFHYSDLEATGPRLYPPISLNPW